jgi:hypothetical protein
VARHDADLLGHDLALGRDQARLIGEARDAVEERLDPALDVRHQPHHAPHDEGHDDHRRRDHDEGDGGDDRHHHRPERRVARTHL